MTLELGGDIQLTGFRALDPATLKIVHQREKSEKYEIHAHIKTDTTYTADVVERNLMIGLDSVLKKVEKEMRPRD